MKNSLTRQSAGEAAILNAAVRLFSANGYDAVSMREVASEAGVSKANIYHHFDSKEALYRAILHQSAEDLAGLVETLAEGAGSFESRIAEFAAGHLKHLDGNPLFLRRSALGRQHLRQIGVLGTTEDLQGGQDSDRLAGGPQQRVDPLGDLILDGLLLIGPKKLDHVPAAGLGLEDQTEEEEVAFLVDGLAIQTEVERVFSLVAVRHRIDETHHDFALRRSLEFLEKAAEVALVGDKVLDESR